MLEGGDSLCQHNVYPAYGFMLAQRVTSLWDHKTARIDSFDGIMHIPAVRRSCGWAFPDS